MASYRLRTQIPAQQIGAAINEGEADVLVFSKPTQEDVELARKAKGFAKIVVDVCDPHDYSELLALADGVVCSSEVIRSKVGGAVIPDPIEGPGSPPHAQGSTVFWIGHPSNLEGLRKWQKWLPGIKVNAVTDPRFYPGAIPWSMAAQREAYQLANIVWTPSQAWKSNNRLTQAIHEGCFVIGSATPAYKALRQFAWVGEPTTGMRFAFSRNDLNDIVSEGQAFVRREFSPEAIGAKWRDFLSSI
jgi:hypothetical protein